MRGVRPLQKTHWPPQGQTLPPSAFPPHFGRQRAFPCILMQSSFAAQSLFDLQDAQNVVQISTSSHVALPMRMPTSSLFVPNPVPRIVTSIGAC